MYSIKKIIIKIIHRRNLCTPVIVHTHMQKCHVTDPHIAQKRQERVIYLSSKAFNPLHTEIA